MTLLRSTGSLHQLPAAERDALLKRGLSVDSTLTSQVSGLISQVRSDGDAALRALAARFDRVTLQDLEVPRDEWDRALNSLSIEIRGGLERARTNLIKVQTAFAPQSSEVEVEPGVVVGRRADPLARVGVYAPGGKAAYPSSVLMGVVPAKVAGVGEVIVCTPPGVDGSPSAVVLAAAALAGADRVFRIGGAGAIAAMAFGTESVPRVDRIVGPGNAYVAEAKRQVGGDVGIDSPAGPSEILVIADHSASPLVVARELLAQAEHDPDAVCVALAITPQLADQIAEAVQRLLPQEPRRETIAKALAGRGAVLAVRTLDEAYAFARDFAAEHLLLAVSNPSAALAQVRHAGTVFLGESSSVAFGDYMTGANHVLPTAGAARIWSGLSAADFYRWTTWQRVSPEAATRLSSGVVALATSEGLHAHASAAAQWAERSSPTLQQPSTRPTETGSATKPQPATPPLLRPKSTYDALSLYAPYRPPIEIDLTDNTNLWGIPPAAERVLRTWAPATVTRYPSPDAGNLRAALAKKLDIPAECITTGCGSDDVIDSAIRAYSESGDQLAYCEPTFAMMPTFAAMNGLRSTSVPFLADGAVNVRALHETVARVVYLCTPNNPTGALVGMEDVQMLAANPGRLVIVDEAYVEYSDQPSIARLLRTMPNVLVVRTLSKAYGLAGLRVGYAVGAPELVANIEKSRGPYKVGGLANAAAIAAIEEDARWVDEHIAAVKASRSRLTTELTTIGARPLPSQGNFVLIPTARKATEVAASLRQHGVAVRPFPGLPGIGEAVRVSIGPWGLMQRFLDAWRALP